MEKPGKSVRATRLFLLLIIVCAALVYSGCTTGAKIIGKDFDLSKKSNEGIVIGSLNYPWASPLGGSWVGGKVKFDVMNTKDEETYRLDFTDEKSSMMSSNSSNFFISLPAGKYQIISGKAGEYGWSKTNIYFDVMPGKVTCIGYFNVKPSALGGMSIYSFDYKSAKVEVSDNCEMTSKNFLNQYPNFTKEQVVAQIAREENK